ncbi:ATP-binding protein [Hydrogenophaga sp. UC242_50]|uniref:hybrid sensor histidine kinase/response regulator n=1 Tax=Hydrogenophaga sp. UC242_50 TaxID=3350169 RepID=UPI0036D43C1F
MIGTHTDITEHKQAEAQHRALEAQLRESQKMEAIGTLAGGVAHDFNNLLAAILGNLVLAREDLGEQHPAQESLTEINRAAIRARQLVQQILTFSRRQTQEMVRQPLTPLVEEALGLMRSLLPASLKLVARLPAAGLPVLADATQMQQVLMNLCTNAWQAMEGRSGDITVALRDVRLDASQGLQLGGLAGGAYACLSVADNGPGMDEATQQRIFEPFFTTKAPGAGTGLGLAVVHGIVKAHRGVIALHSRPGEGSRFDVYLPLAAGAADEAPAPAPVTVATAAVPVAPGKHVIYIDDYEALVFLVGRLLRKQGYRTSTFESGEAAIAWLREHPDDPVDLVVTDQNMPGISGVDVAREARQLRPGLRVAHCLGARQRQADRRGDRGWRERRDGQAGQHGRPGRGDPRTAGARDPLSLAGPPAGQRGTSMLTWRGPSGGAGKSRSAASSMADHRPLVLFQRPSCAARVSYTTLPLAACRITSDTSRL